jgi:hypothetical protein
MPRLPLCALGLATALAAPAMAQSGPVELLAAWSAAYAAGPGAPVTRLYAPDARLLSEVSAQEAVGHAEITAYFAAMAIGAAPPRLRIDSHSLRELPGAAYLSGRYTLLREGWDGSLDEEPGRFSLALMPGPGGWRIAGQHSSHLPR